MPCTASIATLRPALEALDDKALEAFRKARKVEKPARRSPRGDVIEAVVKAASGDCGYAVVAAYENGALEAWTGFGDRSAAVLYKCAHVQEDANVVACEVLTDAEVRARAAKRHTLAQCAFLELARRARPWLSIEVEGDRARVIAGSTALPASADALQSQPCFSGTLSAHARRRRLAQPGEDQLGANGFRRRLPR